MNLSYLKITGRSLTKNVVFSIINILGLSISLTVVLLMYLQIQHELSFDKSFKEYKNIYRVNAKWSQIRPGETTATTPAGLAIVMKDNIPAVKATVRVSHRTHVLKVDNFEEDTRINWTDEDFFTLFDRPILYGSPEDIFKRTGGLVLSESKAKLLFGNRDPVGESVMFGPTSMEICAVYKDFPANSSFSDYHIIGAHDVIYNDMRARYAGNFETYCLLYENADTTSMGDYLSRIANDEFKDRGFTPVLQELSQIHLYSGQISGSFTSSPGDIEKVKMLSLLAVIILLIACINYMNLATARAQKRSREIGISKTVGAERIMLVAQLFLETGILTTISFILAFGIAYLSLPYYNNLFNEQLFLENVLHTEFLLGALAILILTVLISASYPAIYLSGFPPLTAIRAATYKGSRNAFVRQVLTVGQFVAAIVLITWVIVIYSQIRYVNNKNMGYDLSHVISFWIRTNPGPDFTPFENALRAQSSILGISRVSFFPNVWDETILRKDMDDTGITMKVCIADEHMIDLLQLKIIAGNPLPALLPGDSTTQIVLNRKAVEYLGSTPEDIIGQRIFANIPGRGIFVCGVVENFHFESLHKPIGEFGIINRGGRFYLMAKISQNDIAGQLKTYKQIFTDFYPNDMFDVHFPELEMKSAYLEAETSNRISLSFSVLAILIACMGVYGLTAFMAEQRKKEMGIRKVMGGSVTDIVALFINNYVKLLLISLVIAIPIAWWVGNLYLQNFAYRISLSWWMFAVAAMITIALTLLTVSVQAIKAAIVNPVKVIHNE